MNKHLIGIMIAALFIIALIGGTTSASSVYKVKNGDTLWDIAKENSVAVEDLLHWNGLQSALIFPGQEIKINNKQEVYVVQKGDTLSVIAQKHQVAVADVMEWNRLSGHLIYPGDELTMNGVTKTKEPATVNTKTNTKETENNSSEKSAPAPKEKQAVTTPPSTNQVPTAAAGKEMTVTATAYTAFCKGCSGTTFTGIDLRANPNQKVIAVDPSIIPLGSRVWVEGYGEAIAGDIGGAIKGNIIDVFLQHNEDALNWGRKTVKIKILD